MHKDSYLEKDRILNEINDPDELLEMGAAYYKQYCLREQENSSKVDFVLALFDKGLGFPNYKPHAAYLVEVGKGLVFIGKRNSDASRIQQGIELLTRVVYEGVDELREIANSEEEVTEEVESIKNLIQLGSNEVGRLLHLLSKEELLQYASDEIDRLSQKYGFTV